jgi:hypothetical protein
MNNEQSATEVRMIYRIYHKRLGGHVHMRVFAGKQDGGLGKCGDLIMRDYEFDEFRSRAGFIHFIEEQ